MKNATPTLRMARCAKFNHLGEEVLGDDLLYVFIKKGKALRIRQTDDEHFNVFASFNICPARIFGKDTRLASRDRCASLWICSFGQKVGTLYEADADLTEREVEQILVYYGKHVQ